MFACMCMMSVTIAAQATLKAPAAPAAVAQAQYPHLSVRV